jgi:hypothetical protein
MRLSLKNRIRLQLRYKTALSLYGDTPKALFWSDATAQ